MPNANEPMPSGGHDITGDRRREEQPGCLGYLIVICVLGLIAAITPNSSPEGPSPPSSKTATFYSDVSASVPLMISLTGGSYVINYVILDSNQFRVLASSADVFIADFKTGTTFGSLKKASSILLRGACRVNIGSFRSSDALKAKLFVEDNKFIEASFNASAPTTGPPSDIKTKTIYVEGTITEFSIDGFKGDSKGDISVLELDPSSSEWQSYRAQKRAFEMQNEHDRVRSRPRI